MRDVSIRQLKILIIDDEADMVDYHRRILEQDGYREIESTTDPLAAVQLFREFQPDLIILDLVMPGRSGWEVLADLRAIIPTETHLPILVVTGDPTIETRREALDNGATDFICKPFDIGEILARIANLLETLVIGRKKAADAMRESEELFFGAFEHAPIGVALVSPEGKWLKVNRALCDLVGYSRAELLTRTFQDITRREDLPENLENMRQLLAGETRSYQMEKRYVHARGSLVTVLLNVSLIHDEHGQARHFIIQVLDITERKRAEEAIRESEERFSGAFEYAPIGLALVAPDGRWTKVNRALCVLFGYSEDELLTHTYQDMTHPEDLAASVEHVRRLAAGEIPSYQMEKRYIHAHGHCVTVVLNASVVRDGQGQTRYFISQFQDVTARKRAEQELHWKTALLEAQVHSSLDGMLVVDEQGRKILQNQRFTDLLKIPRDIADDEDDRGQIQWVTNAARNPELFIARVVYLYSHPGEIGRDEIEMKDGMVVDRYSAPVIGKDGKYYGRIWVLRDITERKRIDAVDKRLAAIVEYADEAIISKTLEGIVTSWNPAAERMFGYSALEIIGQSSKVIIPPDRADEESEVLAGFARGELVRHLETVRVGRDGQRFDVSATISPIKDPAGRIIGLSKIVRNITERKRAEEALKESEERYRALIDRSPESISVHRDGNLLFVNPALIKMLGATSAGELIGRPVFDLLHPDFHQIVRERLKSNVRYGGVLPTMEQRFIRLDGKVIDVEVCSRSILYDGEAAIYSSIREITERKQAEATRDRLAIILEATTDLVSICEPGGNLLYLNRAGRDLLGVGHDEDITKTTVADFVPHPTDHILLTEGIPAAARCGAWNGETVLLNRRGHEFPVSQVILAHKTPGGNLESFSSIMRDITERKRDEEELFRSREMLRRILDQIPQRVFWKDRDLVYVGCNQAFAVDMGFREPSEVIGKTDFEAPWKEMAEHYRADDRSVIDLDSTISSFEEPGIAPNGRALWYRTTKCPLHDREGKVTGILGTFEDITEHKLAKLEIESLNADLEQRVAERTEELFAVTREAENANSAKSEFLSRTSHELRTPLNAILGFGQLLETEENLGVEARESVAQLLSSARHLLSLIDKVLAISDTDSRRITLSLETVAVDRLVEETLCLLRPLADAFQIELESRPPLGNGGNVVADAQRLKQVLFELLSNAIKYNRPRGKVILEWGLAEAADPPAFRFSIQDTGPGISALNLTRLFTPFDRLDEQRTQARISGTGLGLAVSKRMIELMGGLIGVASRPGEGSTFWIEVPLAESPGEPRHQSALSFHENPPSKTPGQKTLLYVEESLSNLRLITRIVARRPAIQLCSAATGALGLEMARTHSPDLILLDADLPGSQGDPLLALLRSDPRTLQIPVIVLLSDPLPGVCKQMMAAGARAFLTKPVEVRTLLGVLDRYIEFHPEEAG